MYIKEIITQIRDNCPLLEDKVFPTHDLERELKTGEDSAKTPPFLYVMSTRIQPKERGSEEQDWQDVTETFLTLLCVDNKSRRQEDSDLSPYDQVQATYQELYNALIGWRPTPNGQNAQLLDAYHFMTTESRLYWIYEWTYGYRMKSTVPEEADTLIGDFYVAQGQDGTIPQENYCQLTENGEVYEPTPES